MSKSEQGEALAEYLDAVNSREECRQELEDLTEIMEKIAAASSSGKLKLRRNELLIPDTDGGDFESMEDGTEIQVKSVRVPDHDLIVKTVRKLSDADKRLRQAKDTCKRLGIDMDRLLAMEE